MIDVVSLTSQPAALMSKQLAQEVAAGVAETFPILPGSRPVNQVAQDGIDNASPGLGGKIDVIA